MSPSINLLSMLIAVASNDIVLHFWEGAPSNYTRRHDGHCFEPGKKPVTWSIEALPGPRPGPGPRQDIRFLRNGKRLRLVDPQGFVAKMNDTLIGSFYVGYCHPRNGIGFAGHFVALLNKPDRERIHAFEVVRLSKGRYEIVPEMPTREWVIERTLVPIKP